MGAMKRTNRQRHSYVAFFMDAWYGGTARMSRTVESVYFQVCLYNWDKVRAVPRAEQTLMLADLEGRGEAIVDALVDGEHLKRNDDGSIYSPRALDEAESAFALWEARSRGGRGKLPKEVKTVRTVLQDSSEESSNERERERESIPVGTAGAADPLKDLFDMGVGILTHAGRSEKQARSLIGKWRKQMEDDGPVLTGLIECRARGISDPVEWLTKRFAGGKRYVSASGYEYRGTPEQVLREAQKRNDMATYWSVKGDIKKTA